MPDGKAFNPFRFGSFSIENKAKPIQGPPSGPNPGPSALQLIGSPAGSVQAKRPTGSTSTPVSDRRQLGSVTATQLTGALGLSQINEQTRKRLLGA